MAKIKFIDQAGANAEVDLGVEIYQEAADAGASVVDHINHKYPTDSAKHGTAFEQFLASAGLFQKADGAHGIKPPTLAEIVNGKAQAGVVHRDGQPASRILFPATVLAAMEAEVPYDGESDLAIFDRMIAIKDTSNGPRAEHPVIDYGPVGTHPGNVVRSQPIAQGSYPAAMVSIKAADKAIRIPTFAIGMEVTDEALAATSLPLVTMALTRQAELERLARLDGHIQQLVWGDIDNGEKPLDQIVPVFGPAGSLVISARDLDHDYTGDGLSHKAWVRWLSRNRRRRHITHTLMTINTWLAVEAREGRPNYPTQDVDSKLANPLPKLANPQWSDVETMIVPEGVLPDGMILGLDRRYGIRKVTNSQAAYSATEAFVLKKTNAMRFDFGEQLFRLNNEAFDVLMLGADTLPGDPR